MIRLEMKNIQFQILLDCEQNRLESLGTRYQAWIRLGGRDWGLFWKSKMLFFRRVPVSYFFQKVKPRNIGKEKIYTSMKESGQTWLSQLLKKFFILRDSCEEFRLQTNINLSLGRLALKFHSVWSIIIPFTKSYVE